MRFRGGAPGGGVVARVSAHRIFRPLVNPAVLPRTPPFAAGITYGVNITPVLRPALCDVSLLQSVRWQYDASGRFQGGCSCLPQQFNGWCRFRLDPEPGPSHLPMAGTRSPARWWFSEQFTFKCDDNPAAISGGAAGLSCERLRGITAPDQSGRLVGAVFRERSKQFPRPSWRPVDCRHA